VSSKCFRFCLLSSSSSLPSHLPAQLSVCWPILCVSPYERTPVSCHHLRVLTVHSALPPAPARNRSITLISVRCLSTALFPHPRQQSTCTLTFPPPPPTKPLITCQTTPQSTRSANKDFICFTPQFLCTALWAQIYNKT